MVSSAHACTDMLQSDCIDVWRVLLLVSTVTAVATNVVCRPKAKVVNIMCDYLLLISWRGRHATCRHDRTESKVV